MAQQAQMYPNLISVTALIGHIVFPFFLKLPLASQTPPGRFMVHGTGIMSVDHII